MQISYHGLGCFTLRGKNATVICDPYDPKKTGVALKKLKGDITTISREEGGEALSTERVDMEGTVLVDWPGEYEYKGISIIGIQTWQNKKGEAGSENPNTAFTYYLDDMHVCHLGKLGHSLAPEQIDEIGDVDILLVPVGGMGSLNADKVQEVIDKIEPRLVIPMYYSLPNAKEKMGTLESFLKKDGSEPQKMEMLKVSKRDLPSDEKTQTVLLEVK